MLTKLGYTLRVYRIEHGLRLKDMAEAIGIPLVTLSAIEHGRLAMSKKCVEKIIEVYQLPSDLADTLRMLQQECKPIVRIPTHGDPLNCQLLAAFKRNLGTLSSDQKLQILQILDAAHAQAKNKKL